MATRKRILDLFICILLAPIAAPAMLVCALMVRFSSPGPIIFRQTRIGKDHRPFEILKFRTMVDGAQFMGAGLYNVPNDPRYTKVGLFLRRFSLDELMQLINVARGDMSVVGPRPAMPEIVTQYKQEYDLILLVKPGLTGLSQVNGRNEISRRKRLELDAYYAQHYSVKLDLDILWRTFGVVLTGEGQDNSQSQEEVER
jgi:lipopolysaccharide/colanic/teichoic acid biosynthesis glycosyltransferase